MVARAIINKRRQAMAAYLMSEIEISDTLWGEEYGERVKPILAKRSGKLISRSSDAVRVEGKRSTPTIAVVLEFPTSEAAQAWHSEPDYKPLINLGNTGSSLEALLVGGV
jgi:uncharacterized protein (DUF1330 family)